MSRTPEELYVQDRSAVCRFRPGGLAELEYLQALPPDGVEAVYGPLATAHVFFTHGDAERWGKEHRYQTPDGKWPTPWGHVLPGAEPLVRREELPTVTKPPRARNAARVMTAASAYVEPEEVFAELEKRGLA